MKKYKNEFESLTPLAKWKLQIIHDGLDCEDARALENIDGIKTKFKNIIPTVKNEQFFDASKDKILIPTELYLTDSKHNRVLTKFNYNPESKFKLIIENKELYIINKKDKRPIDIKVEVVKEHPYISLEFNGRPLEEYAQILGQDRIGILAYEGCWHWNIGKQCLFCDSNPKRNWRERATPSINLLKELGSAWWEKQKKEYLEGISYTLKKIFELGGVQPHQHLALMAGNLPKLEDIWNISGDIAKSINSVRHLKDFDSYINLLPPPKEKRLEFLKKAKQEWGFNNIQINLEVIGEKAFQTTCPGKSELVGYKNMKQSLIDAAKIFGEGKSRSNFVLGAQSMEILLAGIKKLAANGVVGDYSVFVPKKYTAWQNKPKPDKDEIAYFTKQLVKIYKENNFKPLYCQLSSRSSIANEVYYKI